MQPSSEIDVGLGLSRLSSVPMELTTVINPLTMKAGAKLSSPALKIQVSGFLDHRKYCSALETSSYYLVYDW